MNTGPPNISARKAAIVSMLQKAGFQMKPQFPVFSTWLDQLFAAQADPKNSPDLMYIGHGNELIDPDQTFGLYISCQGEASGYCNPKVQLLGTEGRTVLRGLGATVALPLCHSTCMISSSRSPSFCFGPIFIGRVSPTRVVVGAASYATDHCFSTTRVGLYR